jgi:uncharacterized protein YndB with AHSA1/START domain
MIQYEISTLINCPVERVFEFAVDQKNLPRWQSSFVSGQQMTEGPRRVGTQVREVRRMGPRQVEIQAEITTFDVNKAFATRTISQPPTMVNYTFAAENGGTRVTFQFTLQPTGFMRLIEPFIAGPMKQDSVAALEQLKQILEH